MIDRVLRPRFLGSFLILCLFCGCGGGEDMGTVPAKGVVKLDGNPLSGAVVAFSAGQGSGETGGGQFSGYTDEDGEFSLMYSKSVEGIPPGEYRVTVRSISDLNPGGPGITPGAPRNAANKTPSVLPKRFMNFDESGLTAAVKAGEDNFFEFDLKSE